MPIFESIDERCYRNSEKVLNAFREEREYHKVILTLRLDTVTMMLEEIRSNVFLLVF